MINCKLINRDQADVFAKGLRAVNNKGFKKQKLWSFCGLKSTNLKVLQVELPFSHKKHLGLKVGRQIFLKKILQEHNDHFFSYSINLDFYTLPLLCVTRSVVITYESSLRDKTRLTITLFVIQFFLHMEIESLTLNTRFSGN